MNNSPKTAVAHNAELTGATEFQMSDHKIVGRPHLPRRTTFTVVERISEDVSLLGCTECGVEFLWGGLPYWRMKDAWESYAAAVLLPSLWSEEKRPISLVMWSGGCDSTLVLYRDARDSTPNKPARALRIIHPQLPANTQQQIARERIKREFVDRHLPVEYTEVSFTNKGDACIGDFRQSALWISIGALHIRENENMLLGYIRSDTIWHSKWTLGLFTALVNEMRAPGCQLLFPLEWKTKQDVIQELKEAKLVGLCWSCDSYEGVLYLAGSARSAKKSAKETRRGKKRRTISSRQVRSRAGSWIAARGRFD